MCCISLPNLSPVTVYGGGFWPRVNVSAAQPAEKRGVNEHHKERSVRLATDSRPNGRGGARSGGFPNQTGVLPRGRSPGPRRLVLARLTIAALAPSRPTE